ncbi:bifunctional copper resistance protein CopD/cytochrome c oxidase assembly protein [Corynebacterium ulcerans]|uniref:cytochrome c oxidase assembly protein n=1 Tax=Corynebacterium ulcerans TaxID=65058 RepID=UPI00052AD255|nr:cytochrome c oxidase assembly protein [Corynebacterium ulcerans]AIU92348.1 Copper resistance D domain-containing protein/Cytochrome c oxidase caa3 assembly factor (Caa3_CtaG) [Corynebacterium ulcerans]NOL62958.1 bifunctional copper resistance protein CopD/cytochrome c oxidase assembly protein [Corynebacterium ulcerans]NON15521.1 bifunctional copper resistance protein CopD/cytochrome c oxidase assembly protein [Corynebacterium ulcerans]
MSNASSPVVRVTWPLYLAFLVVAGLVGALISWGFLSESLAALGIPDPGPVTTAGLPFFRAAGWMLAALGVGSFMFSAFFVSPRANASLDRAELSVDGHIAARTGSVAVLCFGAIAVLMIPLVLSDVSGQPFSQAVQLHNWPIAITKVPAALAWLWTAIISGIVGGLSLLSKRWKSQPVWFVGAIATIIPLGLEGHSAAGGDHDYGTNSLLWHLLFMLLWVGGLMALIAHGRRLGPDLGLAVSRYSQVALWSLVAMSISGVINAAIRVRVEDLFASGYGRLIVAKAIITIILAVFGFVHRAITVPQLQKSEDTRGLFARIAIVEVLVMAAIMGVAISLGRTPPPPPRVTDLSQMSIIMGYDLTKAPTFWNVWTVWRFDIMFTTLGIVLTVAYVVGLLRLRAQGKQWKWQRTFWFLLGSISLSLCMSSGVGLYMPAMFSMHMVTHMVLSMVIPVFLVLGNPLQLALATLRSGTEAQPGPKEWLEQFIDSKTLRVVMHPAFNTIQFVTIFYLLYVTPWYEVMVSEHAGHLSMNWVFLLSGTLYYWEMIGGDPKPVNNSVLSRLGWLVFSMPFHLYFGVYLMQLSKILAEGFYSQLGLPWAVDLMHDQNVGGGIAWASGAFPLVIVFGALFMEWLKEDRRTEREIEKRIESDDDEDFAAYNQMLARMNSGEQGAAADYHSREFDK